MHFNQRTIELVPYKVSARMELLSDENWLILDWNECTKPISDNLKNALCEFIQEGKLNLYSDVDAIEIRKSLSQYLKIPMACMSVFNGSDSALNIVLECILQANEVCLLSEPEYSQIKTFIHVKGGVIKALHHDDVFNPDLIKIDDALSAAKVFYISNPNNPTGNFIPIDHMEELIRKHPSVWFLIDEAYIDFCLGENHLSLIAKYKNLIILRTFSKAFGLAGLRLGYILSNEENIQQINKVRNGKEVNSIAQFAGVKLLSEIDTVNDYIKEVRAAKEWFISRLNSLSQVKAYNSDANFVIVKSTHFRELSSWFFDNKILVRDRSTMPGLENCMRITIGTRDQMNKVFDCIKAYFDKL
jgi:histidinol-phosphate aminotransferase